MKNDERFPIETRTEPILISRILNVILYDLKEYLDGKTVVWPT